jgi:hypothetical protein
MHGFPAVPRHPADGIGLAAHVASGALRGAARFGGLTADHEGRPSDTEAARAPRRRMVPPCAAPASAPSALGNQSVRTR